MAIDLETRRRLSPRAMEALNRTEKQTDATHVRLMFGPELTDEGPYAPTSELAQRLARHAEASGRAWLDIHATHFRSMADRTAEEGAAFLRSARHAKRKMKELGSEADALLDSVGARADWLDGQKAAARKAPTSVGEAMIDSEMRAMIRAEKDPAKLSALIAAHPRAVATAPALASGLGEHDAAYAKAVDAHLRATIPDVMAEADDLGMALKQFQRSSEKLSEYAKGLIDFDLADSLESGAQWGEAA